MTAAREIVLRALFLKWDEFEEQQQLNVVTGSKQSQSEMLRPSGTGGSGTYAG